MRNFITILILMLALTAINVHAETLLGQFSVGEIFDRFQYDDQYLTTVAFHGILDRTMLVYLTTSPDNPKLSTGYLIFQVPVQSKQFSILIGGIKYIIEQSHNGKVIKVWVKD